MMELIVCLISAIKSAIRSRQELALENLALRQQLAMLKRRRRRPRLRRLDQLFWIWLSRFWDSWKESLLIVKPQTVIRWHRRRFAWPWTRISRKQSGRPSKDFNIRELIRKMASANPLWEHLESTEN
jgi:hypothetical protein